MSPGNCGPRGRKNITLFCLGSFMHTTRLQITQSSCSCPLVSFCKSFLIIIAKFRSLPDEFNVEVYFSVFRLVIYFHVQVVDGQRRIIRRLENQIENVSKTLVCFRQELCTLLTSLFVYQRNDSKKSMLYWIFLMNVIGFNLAVLNKYYPPFIFISFSHFT